MKVCHFISGLPFHSLPIPVVAATSHSIFEIHRFDIPRLCCCSFFAFLFLVCCLGKHTATNYSGRMRRNAWLGRLALARFHPRVLRGDAFLTHFQPTLQIGFVTTVEAKEALAHTACVLCCFLTIVAACEAAVSAILPDVDLYARSAHHFAATETAIAHACRAHFGGAFQRSAFKLAGVENTWCLHTIFAVTGTTHAGFGARLLPAVCAQCSAHNSNLLR